MLPTSCSSSHGLIPRCRTEPCLILLRHMKPPSRSTWETACWRLTHFRTISCPDTSPSRLPDSSSSSLASGCASCPDEGGEDNSAAPSESRFQQLIPLGQIVQRVVGDRMPERLALRVADPVQVHLMHVPDLHSI